MKKEVCGGIKFLKPVVEKVIEFHLVGVNSEGKTVKKSHTEILTYEEMDKDEEELTPKVDFDIKLKVIDQTITVNFGDEEIERYLDTVAYYDEEWIKQFNPDYSNFTKWLKVFVSELIFE